MMELLYWLLLGALLVGLAVLAIQTLKLVRRPSLTVVEPIGTVIKDWHIARFEPDTEAIKKLFKALASVNLSSGSLLEGIVMKASARIRLRSRAAKLTLIDQRSVAPLAEQLLLEMDGKSQSVLVGPLGQIANLVEDEKVDRYHHLSLQAAEHGYLALAVASALIHRPTYKLIKHELSGLVILEPIFEQGGPPLAKPIRFLTAAPLQFAAHLYGQLFGTRSIFGVNAAELATLPPRFAEADLAKASVVAAADLTARHHTLQSWQQSNDCVYISVNPEDGDLPAAP